MSEIRKRKVFINYRRNDNPDFVDRIRDWFINAYGHENVFMDFDSISTGARFADVIQGAVKECDAFVAIIGPQWQEILDKRRLNDDAEDFVQTEIRLALENKKLIVPICIKAAPIPDRSRLPKGLRELLDYNVGHIESREVFHERIEHIVDSVENELLKRERQQIEIQRLDTTSPAAGLVLGYYVNFVQTLVSRVIERTPDKTGYAHPIEINLNSPVQIGEDRDDLVLNIIVPHRIGYLSPEKIAAAKAVLLQASIQTSGRPFSVFARQTDTAARYEFVDFPTTITAIEKWIVRHMKQSHSTAAQLEQQEIERFEIALNWWVEYEESDLRSHIRVLRYDPDKPIKELLWLYPIWGNLPPLK